ncbi:MAG: 5-formyltetrahydrofolate cyclo-ligase [Desulfobacteraceae bacterium]|nr:5-formyltetrahydrofolate cyclo-ligase [Desulfobacteraceae bacterium]
MEEIRETKLEIRAEVAHLVKSLSGSERTDRQKAIEERLFGFANFLEANIVLLYVGREGEVPTDNILRRCHDLNKVLVLPAFHAGSRDMTLMKVDHLKKDLKVGPRGVLEPDPNRCKIVPIDYIDIAIVPGIALDEKGARIGSGDGYYDRLIPRLSITTRKVALAFEEQIVPQVPMEPHDKHVDIIITDQRIVYKI